ncbi:MAG: diaminopimelate epimerase [Limosilactobacillus sp.]
MPTLLKVHGSMNQFFILDQTRLQQPLTDPELRQLAQQLTNPQTGLLDGADGLLVVDKPFRPGAQAQMRVINADGSEATMCGNGLRTVARYVASRDHLDQFKVDTVDASLRVRKQDSLADGVPAFAVEISPVRFNKEALPFNNLGHDRLLNTLSPEIWPQLRFSAIAVPNPHLISFVDRPALQDDVLGVIGRRLNGENPYFGDGVNVNFAHILGQNQLFVRTYERGVGFTNACGTGMSATSLTFALLHPTQASFDQPITVFNPGGMVRTIVHYQDSEYWIELIGNATFTHRIAVDEDALHHATVRAANCQITATGEQEAYQAFVDQLPQLDLVD